MPTLPLSHAEIALLAAQLWEERGRPLDHDEEIWLQAEQQLLVARGHPQPESARSAQHKPAARKSSARRLG